MIIIVEMYSNSYAFLNKSKDSDKKKKVNVP